MKLENIEIAIGFNNSIVIGEKKNNTTFKHTPIDITEKIICLIAKNYKENNVKGYCLEINEEEYELNFTLKKKKGKK